MKLLRVLKVVLEQYFRASSQVWSQLDSAFLAFQCRMATPCHFRWPLAMPPWR